MALIWLVFEGDNESKNPWNNAHEIPRKECLRTKKKNNKKKRKPTTGGEKLDCKPKQKKNGKSKTKKCGRSCANEFYDWANVAFAGREMQEAIA